MAIRISAPTGTGYSSGPVVVTTGTVTVHTNLENTTQSVFFEAHGNDGIAANLLTVVWNSITITKEMTEGVTWPLGPWPLAPGASITVTAATGSAIVAGAEVRTDVPGA